MAPKCSHNRRKSALHDESRAIWPKDISDHNNPDCILGKIKSYNKKVQAVVEGY